MEQRGIGSEDVRCLGDVELIAGLRQLVRTDRAVTARLLIHLGEVDARGLYREHAFPSMFAYAVEELRMSEAEAYLRIQAARLGRQFPLILQMLAKGELHLTAIKLLGPHLTQDNHAQVVERARFKGKREIEELVAELAPKPDVQSAMRKLPEPASARASKPAQPQPPAASTTEDRDRKRLLQPDAPRTDDLAGEPSPEARVSTTTSRNSSHGDREPFAQPRVVPTTSRDSDDNRDAFQLKAPPARTSSITPLRPGRYEIKFTAGQAMCGKLDHLKNLLRHQVPDGDLGNILERAADLLIEKTMKDRFAQPTKRSSRALTANGRPAKSSEQVAIDASARPTERAITASAQTTSDSPEPCAITSSPRAIQAHSRYVPRSVVREVHARDGEQCTFVSSDGKRCAARGFLELDHHDTPYARGGHATAANLRTMCRAHNALLAEREFGRAFMESKLAQARVRKREAQNKLVLEREHE